MVGRRGENFGVEKRWKKKIHAGREDGIFVHLQNGFIGLILNWCIGGCWFTPARCGNCCWSRCCGCVSSLFNIVCVRSGTLPVKHCLDFSFAFSAP